MLPEEVEKKIRTIIGEVNPDIYIVELALHRGNQSKLVLLIDTDEGISLKNCTSVSRKMSWYFEEEEVFDFPYTLEVSSPGIDRPLNLHRQYVKNIGRVLKVVKTDGAEEKGKLIEVNENDITLEPPKPKKKKKKIETTDLLPKKVMFEEIKEATVVISFG